MGNGISSYSKEILKGTSWSLIGNIFFKLLSFVYVIVLARMATQDDIGIFYLVLSIIGLLALFVDLGFSQSFARYIPYFKARKENQNILKLLKSSYAISILLALFFSFLLFWQADFITDQYQNNNLKTALVLLIPYLALYVLFHLNVTFFQGQKDVRAMVLTNNLQNATKLLFSLGLFLFAGADILTISISFLVSFLVAVLVSLFFVYSNVKKLDKMPSEAGHTYPQLLREILPFSLMLTVVTSLWTIITSLDRIMIGFLLPPDISASQVAIYSISTSLATLLMIFPGAIGTMFFPVVSQLVGENKIKEIQETCSTSIRWVLFITVPFMLVLVIFSTQILTMFYGASYVTGALAMSIFTMGLLIRSLSMLHSYVLASMRLIMVEMKVAMTAAFANIVLNTISIPVFGIEGAATASAISFSIATILFFYYGKKHFDFSLDRGAWQLIFAAIFSFAVVFLLEPYISGIIPMLPETGIDYLDKVLMLSVLAALFLISVSIFALLSILTKSLKGEDLSILSSALRRAKVPKSIISKLETLVSYGIHSSEAKKANSA